MQFHTGAGEQYRVGVPSGGFWKEVLNSDGQEYAARIGNAVE